MPTKSQKTKNVRRTKNNSKTNNKVWIPILIISAIIILAVIIQTGIIDLNKIFNPGVTPTLTPSVTPTSDIKTANVKLYFPLSDNSYLGIEKRDIEFFNDKEKIEKTLKQLMIGPFGSGLRNDFNKGVILNSVLIDGTKVTLDFSNEFLGFSGLLDEASRLAAIVNTVVQFPEFMEVKITIDGVDLIGPSGNPRGFMKYTDYDLREKNVKKTITIYFGEKNAEYVMAEPHIISIKESASPTELYTAVVNEIIKGPSASSKLYKTVPPEARIINLKVDGDVVTVDFSAEMLTKHWRGSAGEAMTIASLVDSLTEYKEVKRVLLLIEGQPMNIDSMVVDEPLVRDENTIKK